MMCGFDGDVGGGAALGAAAGAAAGADPNENLLTIFSSSVGERSRLTLPPSPTLMLSETYFGDADDAGVCGVCGGARALDAALGAAAGAENALKIFSSIVGAMQSPPIS